MDALNSRSHRDMSSLDETLTRIEHMLSSDVESRRRKYEAISNTHSNIAREIEDGIRPDRNIRILCLKTMYAARNAADAFCDCHEALKHENPQLESTLETFLVKSIREMHVQPAIREFIAKFTEFRQKRKKGRSAE